MKRADRDGWRGSCAAATVAAVALALTGPPAKAQAPAPPSKPASISPPTEPTRMRGVSYHAISFHELPQWEGDDHRAALKAFMASCPKIVSLRRAAAAKGGGARTPPALATACEEALKLPAAPGRSEAKAFFEKHFRPYRVVHAGHDGLMTGYYEPLIEGSRTRSARFQAPLLKRPPNLVTVVKETDPNPAGKATHAQRTAAGLVPFATRAEIDAGALAGQNLELLYLRDPVDVYFLQVQGSGRVHLDDGTIVRVQYDGKNGHPYTSIGRYLIDSGLLAADKMSLGALGKWLKADIERAKQVMSQNASYVFFKEMPAGDSGPPGAIEVPLVPGRSIAVDPGVHALGSPIYVSAPALKVDGRPFNRLMVAHDVGAAIKGPERADIFFGSGESAGRAAGATRHQGNLFVLLARDHSEGPAATIPPFATVIKAGK